MHSGISSGVTCLLPERCPAWRRRELGLGADTKRGNLSPRYVAAVHLGFYSHPVAEREDPKGREPRGAEYRCGARGRTVS